MVNRENEELLKDRIFAIFNEFKNEMSHDRRQTQLGQFCSQLMIWCNKYLFKEEDIGERMGAGIFLVARRITKDENIVKFADNRKRFFNNLYKRLKNEKIKHEREFKKDTIHIPKGKITKLNYLNYLKRNKENILNRELSQYELDELILFVFKKKQDYYYVVEALRIKNFSLFRDDEDNEIDILDTMEDPLYGRKNANNLLDEYMIKFDTETIRNAIKSVLKKKQQRSRSCCKAIFTLYCIEKIRNYEVIDRVLDRKIIKRSKNKAEELKRYKIYREYHPDVTDESAQVRASNMLKDFLHDLEVYLKEKNPEVFEQSIKKMSIV